MYVHWLLIIGTLLMWISGFMMSAMGGHGFSFFGLDLAACNPNRADPQEVVALIAALARVGHALHVRDGYLQISAVGLHVVGAREPNLIDRDGTLRRLLGAEVGVAS